MKGKTNLRGERRSMRLYIIAIAAMLMPTMAFAAQKQMPLYMYGFAASFNDSTVCFTEIQQLNATWVDSKTGFLYSRDNYSYQLRENLQGKGSNRPTCITVYAKTRKEIEKKYANMKKRYATNGRYDIKYLTSQDFTFEAIEPDDSEKVQNATNKKEAKKTNKKKQQ